jgi:hypothetical protein
VPLVVDISFPKRDADQAALAPQTAAADPQVSQSIAGDTPTRDEIPAFVDVADRSQTEISEAQSSEAQSGALLKQFQTWAAERDPQATPVEAAAYSRYKS